MTKCYMTSFVFTVHLDGEDAFVTCRPHRTFNTRLAQQQSWNLPFFLIYVSIGINVFYLRYRRIS